MKIRVAIGGTLFPAEYLIDRLATVVPSQFGVKRAERRFRAWWLDIERSCGPASGLRTLIDQVAMPLFGALGYKACNLRINPRSCSGLLHTPAGTAVPFLVLHWSDRPPSLWRDAATLSRQAGVRWCFVLAPPFLSVVDARGWAVRRSLDVYLPGVLRDPHFRWFHLLVDASAFDAPPTTTARFEHLVQQAASYQSRVRKDLQIGVMSARRLLCLAITTRGNRTAPSTARAETALDDQALTVVYRILFLLFAESRGLAARGSTETTLAYSMNRLCGDAITGETRYSFWDGLVAITRLSRTGAMIDSLQAPPFNSRLFARPSAPALEGGRPARRTTHVSSKRERLLREALTVLGSRAGPGGRQLIQYADLGVEELGAVYERLLDETPEVGADGTARVPHSDARKRTGTFYTPQALADLVVHRALGPLVDQASSDEILALRVLDPAMGSGAFLVSACRYLESAYSRALVEEGRLADDDLDEQRRAGFRRVIVERCLAGVDNNPVAVQLARLSLWLTTLAADRPLSFLDHRLRVGNSLVGAEPDALVLTGPRHHGRSPPRPLFDVAAIGDAIQRGAKPLHLLLAQPAETLKDIKTKETLWRQMVSDRSALAPWRDALSLWCAHWFWPHGTPRPSDAERRALVDAVLRGDGTLNRQHVQSRLATVAQIAADHRFFHWPLEFPDVFCDEVGGLGDRGFDVVVGNPPWEMLRRDADEDIDQDRRNLVRFIRESGRYPSCDRGHVNLYQPFVDRALSLVRPGGRVGLVLPWGVAVDDGATSLRARLLDTTAVDTAIGFDNAKGLFPIHRAIRFLVLITTTGRATGTIGLRFGLKTRDDLDDLVGHDDPLHSHPPPVMITRGQLKTIGGPLRRLPDLRREEDLAFLETLATRFPALGAPDGWQARFSRELNATDVKPHLASHGLPILEGKHIDRFRVVGMAASRLTRRVALRLLPDARFERARLGYRDVSGASNSRSVIASVIPGRVLTTHTIFCLRTIVTDEQQHFLCGVLNSFVLSGVARLLMGNHLTTSLVESFPVPTWNGQSYQRVIARLARAMSHRADIATDAALEAAVAVIYGLDESAFAALLNRFPQVSADARKQALDGFRRLVRRNRQKREVGDRGPRLQK